MVKPNDFENTQVAGDFVPVELGGHYAVIKNVSERQNSKGGEMVVISIDFDKKDKQAGYFTEAFKKDVRPDKKYPNQAVQYINTESDGKCSKTFKSFLKAFADSNGLDVNAGIKWGDEFTAQFKNKKIGVVYGVVEEEYNGEVKKKRKIRWFCDYAKAGNQNVPNEKLLNDKPAANAQSSSNDWVDVTVEAEEIPFD